MDTEIIEARTNKYESANTETLVLSQPTPAIRPFKYARASIIIRTLNEAEHLESLLQGINAQQTNGLEYEIVLVDSGSTDGTLEIAQRYGCRILHIRREDFSFGRSLNVGCQAASGDCLVLISGHCVPTNTHWLQQLCQPLLEKRAQYVYGRQLGGPDSHFSETRVFAKYFPKQSAIPQNGFYCNNANSAVLRDTWLRYRFDEHIPGLEDMEMAKRLINDGGHVAYVAEAAVYHHHNETWAQVRRRFEREAIALQKIMPHVRITVMHTLLYFAIGTIKDLSHMRAGTAIGAIVQYRWNQYWGAWKGNLEHRRRSREERRDYFSPI